ncbi:MAG: hypothetical protein CMJ64_11845 [Planctomycetaceae bacterium]|nr:hypothetical protein [Planctomycetaceae bacterium]
MLRLHLGGGSRAEKKNRESTMTIFRLIAAALLVAVIGAGSTAQDDSGEKGSFNPKDLDNLEMFLESVKGLAVATNTSQQAYDRTGENTALEEVWSDKDRFPHGTVRWWLDQSPYTNDKKIRSSRVFKTGRDIGQDDHDRPGYIPDGCNGKPCVRGGLIGTGKGEKHNKQPCYFELQLESRDFKIEGPFGLFLLVRPIQQENDAAIMGKFHWSVLIQSAQKNRLEWKNLRQRIPVSRDEALKTDQWQLLELHRDAESNLRCVINGEDVTVGTPKDELPFVFMFLFNNNKGQGFARQDPFAGDIAALVVYRDEVTEKERVKVRDYFNSVYRLKSQ